MLNQNEIRILELFLNTTSDYLTSEEIGNSIDVSDKTSRKYLKELNESLDDDLAEIKSVRGYGNQLIVHDDKALGKLLQDSMALNESKTDLTNVNTPQDRRDFLLRLLFFENQKLQFDELLDDFYISETPLMQDLAEIRKILKAYDLELRNRQDNGITVLGEEQNKRHFIMSYFLIDQYQNNQKSFEHLSFILKNVHLEEILIIVLDEYRNKHLKLNDTIILNVAIHIALALMRVQKGYQISSISNYEYLENSKEIEAAKNIIRRLDKMTGVSLPDEEIYNIALHLKNKQSLEYMLSSEGIKEADLRAQIIVGLKKLEQETTYPYSQDKLLIDGLMAHFVPLILRIQNKGTIQNPFLKEIKNNYPILFSQIKKFLSQIEIIKDDLIADDEWAYIALHVIAAHERQVNSEKSNVLVICATGLGSSQMIGARLKNELGSKLIIKDIISYYEITEDKLRDIDLIISTIDLSNTVFNVPIVNVSVLLNDQDIRMINELISPRARENTGIDNKKKSNKEPSNLEEMINEYFDSDLFIYSEEIGNKEEAMNALITRAIKQDNGIERAFLENQLHLRENFSSVVFTENIAIPHPIEGVSNQSKVAVLLTPKGLVWDQETPNIKLTLLLLPDRFGNQQIESVSRALLPLLDSQESLNKLAKARDFELFKAELIKILSE